MSLPLTPEALSVLDDINRDAFAARYLSGEFASCHTFTSFTNYFSICPHLQRLASSCLFTIIFWPCRPRSRSFGKVHRRLLNTRSFWTVTLYHFHSLALHSRCVGFPVSYSQTAWVFLFIINIVSINQTPYQRYAPKLIICCLSKHNHLYAVAAFLSSQQQCSRLSLLDWPTCWF